MGKTKDVTLDWYLSNKVGKQSWTGWRYFATDVAKEICHYNYKKYKKINDKKSDLWFMCPEKLFMILYVIYGCYLAKYNRTLFLPGFCRRSKSDDTVYTYNEDVLKYYKIDYDVKKFYNKDKSYNKDIIDKKDKKFIHEIVKIFKDKDFASSKSFIESNHLNAPCEMNGDISSSSIGIVFANFISSYTIKVKD